MEKETILEKLIILKGCIHDLSHTKEGKFLNIKSTTIHLAYNVIEELMEILKEEEENIYETEHELI